MKYLILGATTLLVSVNLHAAEKEYCSRNVVCLVEDIQSRSEVVMYSARNRKGFPVTVTLRTKELINMDSNVVLPYTLTLGPYQTRELATLVIRDPESKWRWHVEYDWKPGPLGTEHSGYMYSLPYVLGDSFRVTKSFNEPDSHLGNNKYSIDWGMPEGTPIHAARGGVIGDVIEHFSESGGVEFADKGNFVCVIHDDGTLGYYYHLRQYGSNVKVGQQIEEGSVLGWSGNTGYSSGPHLHFGVYEVIDGYTSRTVPIKFKNGSDKWFVPTTGHVYTHGPVSESEEEKAEPPAPRITGVRLFGQICISSGASQRDCRD